jgi:3-oxoacyl-[acyl-carrier protein] reductase
MNYAHDDSAAETTGFATESHCVIKSDLSAPEGAERLSYFFINQNQRLDCIIFNAGATCRKPFGQIGYDDWNAVMNVNVSIPFLIVQKLESLMNDNGSICFIGSDMGIYPHAVSDAYGVSKAAAHMLAKSLVKNLSGRGIRVNVVAPGFIDTDWQKEKPGWLREKIEAKIALKRFGTPEEVADACMFMVSNPYVNGAVLQLDGGYNFE